MACRTCASVRPCEGDAGMAIWARLMTGTGVRASAGKEASAATAMEAAIAKCFMGSAGVEKAWEGKGSGRALQDDRRIDPPEGEVVAHHVPRVDRRTLGCDVPERRAGRVGVLQVQGGREPAPAHHLDGPPDLDGAAGAQGVAQVALHRADRHARADHVGRGLALGDVAALGGGAVRAHVVDVRCREAGVLQGLAHGDGHGPGFGLGDVDTVRIAAEADDFRMDVRAARLRMFVLLQHEGGGAFAHHEAVAVAVERPWRLGGRGVARAGGEQRVEHRDARRGEFFGATAEHECLAAVADGLVGVADALAAGRAGAGRGNHAPLEAEEQPDVHRRGVRHHLDVAGRGDAQHRTGFQHAPEHPDRLGAARRRSVGDTHAAVGHGGIGEQACVFQRHLAGAHGHLRYAAHRAQQLARVMGGHLEVRDGCGEAGMQFGEGVELRHAAHTAAAGAQRRLDVRPAIAQRGDAGHAGDDDPLH